MFALIYLDRVIRANHIRINALNIHRLVLAASVVGVKFVEDVRYVRDTERAAAAAFAAAAPGCVAWATLEYSPFLIPLFCEIIVSGFLCRCSFPQVQQQILRQGWWSEPDGAKPSGARVSQAGQVRFDGFKRGVCSLSQHGPPRLPMAACIQCTASGGRGTAATAATLCGGS